MICHIVNPINKIKINKTISNSLNFVSLVELEFNHMLNHIKKFFIR